MSEDDRPATSFTNKRKIKTSHESQRKLLQVNVGIGDLETEAIKKPSSTHSKYKKNKNLFVSNRYQSSEYSNNQNSKFLLKSNVLKAL